MKYIAFIPGLLFLSACSTTQGPMDPDFGKAVTAAYEAQIVNSAAVPGAPKADPDVQAGAITRYKSDEVKAPELQDIEDE